MENSNNENEAEKIDWDDDSGEIHTYSHTTVQKPEDGWNEVHRLDGVRADDDPQFVKGLQYHYRYVTDDYRKVLPAQIIGTIIIVALCVGSWFFSPIVGVCVTVFGIAWIVGSWKRAPIKKWKNQAKKLEEEKEEQKYHDSLN